MTPVIRSVGIIGLGLIGGSLARDLAARGIRVRAFDRDRETLRAALDEGIAESALEASLEDTSDLDAVVLAVPLTAALELLAGACDHLARVPLVTDVCSTKFTIGQAADRLGIAGFIGGHPLAGDQRSGWAASRTGLFERATVYFCPPPDTRAGPLSLMHDLWKGTGALPEIIDPRAHDDLLAWTSHLPQAAATALARALAGAGIGTEQLGPGGRDMTRLAGSSTEVWTPIAMDNAASLFAALERLEAELAHLRQALRREDRDAVRRFFELRGPGRVTTGPEE